MTRQALREGTVHVLRRLSWAERLVPPRLALRARLQLQRRLGLLESEFELLPVLTSPDRDAVDVGANAGVFSFALSRLCRTVFAYEPIPQLAANLDRARLANLHVRNAALSDRHGEEVLRIPVQGGLLRSTRATLEAAEGTFVEQKVTVLPLDAQRLSEVSFIKIDVEGHERSVLLGAAETIARCRPNILVELEHHRLEGLAIHDLFDLIRGWSYRGYFYFQGRRHALEDFVLERHQRGRASKANDSFVNNFVFLPEGAALALPATL